MFGFCFRPASLFIKYSKPNIPPLCFLFSGLFFLFRFLFLILLNSRNLFIYSLLLLILLYLTVNCLLPNLTTFGFSNLCLIINLFNKRGRGLILLGVVFVFAIYLIYQLRRQYYRLILKQEQINLHLPFVFAVLSLFQNIFSRLLFLEFRDQIASAVVLIYIFASFIKKNGVLIVSVPSC